MLLKRVELQGKFHLAHCYFYIHFVSSATAVKWGDLGRKLYVQTLNTQLPTNCLSAFDHFVGLPFKGLRYMVALGCGTNVFRIPWSFFRPRMNAVACFSQNLERIFFFHFSRFL